MTKNDWRIVKYSFAFGVAYAVSAVAVFTGVL